eukprot:gene7568-8856_t
MFKLITIVAVVLALTCHTAYAQGNHCADEPGFTAYFTVAAFNTYFESGAASVPLSFYELGNMSVDYNNQRVRVDYVIVMTEGTVTGSLWAFGKTNDQYILSNGVCTHSVLAFPVPSGYTLNETQFVGLTKLGQFEVELYRLAAGQGGFSKDLNQSVLFDSHTCSVVSSTLQNADPSVPGYSTMEYYDFKTYPEEHFFDLPTICTAASSIKKNSNHKSTATTGRSTLLPKILGFI